MLSPEEYRIFDKVIGEKGFKGAARSYSALVTGFQYMTPDNNSSLGGYMNLINLNNSALYDANKTSSSYDEIGNILRDYLKNKP